MNMRHTIVRMSGAGLLATALTLSLAGCAQPAASADASQDSEQLIVTNTTVDAEGETASASSGSVVASANVSSTGIIDTSDLFTDRDLTQTADTSDATSITLQSGTDVQITEGGVYVISGEATDVTIRIEVLDDEKVQLVFDGASITNADAPVVYVVNADKVFVTTTQGTTNTLQVTGSFVADGETNTDAVIFSKDDLVLNGLGTLVISSTDNGISCKDDLKVTGGTYQITAVSDALEANDSIAISDGTFTINTQKDGLHAENDEDNTVGSIYICGGSFDITAASDAIQATTYLQIDGGTYTINAGEALEATYVQINGGTIDLSASDDGINASYKSSSVGTPTIEITGGDLTITMGSGDTDAIDSNGNIIVSGGTIDITAQFAFDYEMQASFTGGTIYVNGEQISEITESMMMGGGMMGGMGGHGGDMGGGQMGGPGGGMMGGPGQQG